MTKSNSLSGAIYATAASISWGILPIYWKQLKSIPSMEVLCHRLLWSFLFYFFILLMRVRWQEIIKIATTPRYFAAFSASGLLIAVNWLLYITAVNSGLVLQASLGYFLTPLMNVLFGLIFLKERLTKAGWVSVFLASLGILVLATFNQQFPWFAILLALTFGTYGLIRKIMPLEVIAASALESLVILPFALFYLIYFGETTNVANIPNVILILLVFSGVITGLPLLWYANAARRLNLSTLGFFQFIAPTLQFMLAVFLYNETFTRIHAYGFLLIWSAIGIYLAGTWKRSSARI